METRRKLLDTGVTPEQAEDMISELVSENFINEERFALAFAGGKFRIKLWGRIRIKTELKRHQVSEYCLKKALAAITDEDYKKTLSLLISKKFESLQTSDSKKKFRSTFTYLVGRGFESDLVIASLNQMLGEKTNDEFRT